MKITLLSIFVIFKFSTFFAQSTHFDKIVNFDDAQTDTNTIVQYFTVGNDFKRDSSEQVRRTGKWIYYNGLEAQKIDFIVIYDQKGEDSIVVEFLNDGGYSISFFYNYLMNYRLFNDEVSVIRLDEEMNVITLEQHLNKDYVIKRIYSHNKLAKLTVYKEESKVADYKINLQVKTVFEIEL